MLAQLAAAEHRCVLVETEVRDEVSNEMADLLRSMEASYKVRPCPCLNLLAAPISGYNTCNALLLFWSAF